MAEKKQDEPGGLIARNRRARFNYTILEKLEAGISLLGTEVKSCRERNVDLAAAFARIDKGQVILCDLHIKPYECGHQFNHEPRRHRKLLLHRKQIDKLIGAVQRDGQTIIPLRLYLNEAGKAKLEIALAKGKKLHDKREASAERDWQRDKARLMRDKG